MKQVDRDYRNHLQAWLNFAVQAKKQTGKGKSKPVYSRFRRFYDYEKAVCNAKENQKKPSRFAGIEKFLKKGGDEHR